jgi:hypothetical protein
MEGEQLMLPPRASMPGAYQGLCVGVRQGPDQYAVIALKIAVFAPTPRASVSKATLVNIGADPSRRKIVRNLILNAYGVSLLSVPRIACLRRFTCTPGGEGFSRKVRTKP